MASVDGSNGCRHLYVDIQRDEKKTDPGREAMGQFHQMVERSVHSEREKALFGASPEICIFIEQIND